MGLAVHFMSGDDPDLLLLRIRDPEYAVPIGIQFNRMPDGASKQFNGDHIIDVFGIKPKGEVVTDLLGRISGESGVIVNILQRTADFVIVDADSRLQVTCVLAQKFRPIVFGCNGGTN